MRENHIDEIDGLRAVAVLAVIAFHFSKDWLPFGYLGVDVFFAISGYVISKSALERINAGRFTVDDFFMRRAKRLLPALATVVVTSIIVAAMVIPRNGPFFTGVAAFLGVSNIVLWWAGHDYFSEVADSNPLIHTWSLGVEEQFYLIFPFLLLLMRKLPKLTSLLLVIVAAASLTFYLTVWRGHPMAAFYLSPFRLWELLGGVLTYLLVRRAHNGGRDVRRANFLKYLLLAALLATLFASVLPESVATVACVAESCGLLYLSGSSGDRNVFLTARAPVFIGEISYSLYLWHWPVVVFGKLLLPSAAVFPVYIALTAMLSIVSYYWLERPLRRRTWSWFGNRFWLTYPAYAAAVAVFAAGAWRALPLIYLGPRSMQERTFLIDAPCHVPSRQGLLTCLQKSKTKSRSIWLVGDSHAGNFAVSLGKAAATLGADFHFLTGRSLYESFAGKCLRAQCAEGVFTELASRISDVSMPGDIVAISFARDRFTADITDISVFQNNLRTFVAQLQHAGLRVVLIQDIPKVCGGEFIYLESAFRSDACRATAVSSRQERTALSNIYAEIGRQLGTGILDPHDGLCAVDAAGELVCTNWLGGHLLYVDASPHLTRWASAALSDFFVAGLRSQFGPEFTRRGSTGLLPDRRRGLPEVDR